MLKFLALAVLVVGVFFVLSGRLRCVGVEGKAITVCTIDRSGTLLAFPSTPPAGLR